MENLNSKVGKRLIQTLNRNSKLSTLIKKLEKICDKQAEKNSSEEYSQEGSVREMLLEYAYSGCALSALNKKSPRRALGTYIRNIEYKLKKNPYTDFPSIIGAEFGRAFE